MKDSNYSPQQVLGMMEAILNKTLSPERRRVLLHEIAFLIHMFKSPPGLFDIIATNAEEECSICKMNFVKGEKLQSLVCLHHFHAECIMKWLRFNRTCPICRCSLLPNDSERTIQEAVPVTDSEPNSSDYVVDTSVPGPNNSECVADTSAVETERMKPKDIHQAVLSYFNSLFQ